MDFGRRVQPANSCEHGVAARAADQNWSHAITIVLSVWAVRAGRVYIHENRAALDLHCEAPEASRRGIDAAAGTDIILPVVGAAGKYVSIQSPLAQSDAEMCAPILVGVNNSVEPD